LSAERGRRRTTEHKNPPPTPPARRAAAESPRIFSRRGYRSVVQQSHGFGRRDAWSVKVHNGEERVRFDRFQRCHLGYRPHGCFHCGSGGARRRVVGKLIAAIAGEPRISSSAKTRGILSRRSAENVFDPLVETRQQPEMRPALAQSWGSAAISSIWTLFICARAPIHDGQPVHRRRRRYSYRRIIDQQSAKSTSSVPFPA